MRFQGAQQRGAPLRAILTVVLALAFLVPLFPYQMQAGTSLISRSTLPAVFSVFRNSAPFTDDDFISNNAEFTRANGFVPCDGMPPGRRTQLQPLSSPSVPEPQSDKNNPKSDNVCRTGLPFRFSLFCRMKTARSPGLPDTFLRISTGEWAPLPRAFTGNRRYLGAVRSFLHLRGDLERMRTRAV